MKKECSIEGCDRVAVRRGWCKLHSNRWLSHGDPHWKPPPAKTRPEGYSNYRSKLIDGEFLLHPRSPMPWAAKGACVGANPDLFFPGRGKATLRKAADDGAVAICRSCPVRLECLQYAMGEQRPDDFEVYGIWGGTTPADRQRAVQDGITAEEMIQLDVEPLLVWVN